MSRAKSKCRGYLHVLSFLAGLLSLSIAQAQTADSPIDFDATCTFLFLGGSAQPNQDASMIQADIACTGSNPVQMRIAPSLEPFQTAFTGVDATVDETMTGPSAADDPKSSALVAVEHTSLLITNSQFESVNLLQDALLGLFNGSLHMQNTSFIGNQAAGLIATDMDEVIVGNSTFRSNTGTYGILQVDATALYVDNCWFENNTNSTALATFGFSTTVSNSVFRWNRGANDGVAMWISNSATSVNITGCQFRYNTGRWGPAVCFQNADDGETNAVGQLLIADTVLEHNVASSGCAVNCSDTDLTYGGAIYAGSAVNSSLSVHGVTMINNTAHFGGALCMWGHYDVNITDCDFQDNIADIAGGAAYLYTDTNGSQAALISTSISRSTFSRNQATSAGGIWMIPAFQNVAVQDSTFTGNRASKSPSDWAGTTWSGGPADGQGGGLYFAPAGVTSGASNTLLLQNSTFASNWADSLGGGAVTDGFRTAVIQGCNFTDNHGNASFGGGLVLQARCLPSDDASNGQTTAFQPSPYSCEANVTDSIFTGNVAGGDGGGGAFFGLDGFMLNITHTTFSSNAASGGAAGLHIAPTSNNAPGSSVVMSSTLFNQNIAIEPPTGTEYATYFENGPYPAVGGLGLTDLACVAILNSTFTQNIGESLSGSHAAIAVTRLSGTWWSCAKLVNVVPVGYDQEDALFNLTGSRYYSAFDMRDTNLSGNAAGLGGCISFEQGTADSVTILSSHFEDNANTASSGGGISAINSPIVQLIQSTMSSQHAHQDGGAVYSSGSKVILTRSNIYTSSANGSGGAIAVEQSFLFLNYSELSNNTAVAQGGGAVSCNPCTAAIFNSISFFNNTSQDVGGVLKAHSETQVVSLQNVTAVGNRAVSGGALYMAGEATTSVTGSSTFGQVTVYIANSTFMDNQANTAVSPMSASNGATSLTTYGTLQGGGGAVNFIGAILWVQHSSFDTNFASSLGGGILYQRSCTPVNHPNAKAMDFVLAYWLDHFAWQAKELATYAVNQSCSAAVLANVTMSHNEAHGAGGAMFLTSATDYFNYCSEDMQEGRDWTQYTFPDNFFDYDQLATPVSLVNLLSHSYAPPRVCDAPAWQASDKELQQSSHGPLVAYPAKKLSATCHNAQLLNSSYSCSYDADKLPVITNFWSTNAVNATTNLPYSSVLVDVQILDDMNQTVVIDYPQQTAVQVQANATVITYLSGQYSTAVSNTTRTASFQELQLHAPTGSVLLTFGAVNHPETATTSVTVNVRACMPGEVPGTSNTTCNRCLPGLYSFDPGNQICDVCPDHANCSVPLAMFPVLEYWHSGPQASMVHPCPNKDACRGDRGGMQQCWLMATADDLPAWQQVPACSPRNGSKYTSLASNSTEAANMYLDWQCSEGYEDRLCSVCQKGYGASGRFKCSKCSSKGVAIAEYFFMLLGVLLLNLYLISQLSRATMSDFNTVQGSDYLQGFQLYLQLMSILATLNVEWPPVMGHIFTACGYATNLTPQVVPLDCLIHATGLPVHVSRTIIQIIVPIIIMAILMVSFCIYHAVRGDPTDPYWLRCHMKITAFSVAGFFYPSLAQAALNIFSCFPIDSPIQANQAYPHLLKATWKHGYWVLDMSTRCFHGWHLTFTLTVGLLSIMIFCIGIPLVSLLVLCHKVYINQDNLGNPEVVADVGFLYRSYNYENGLWWEGPVFQVKMTALLLVVVIGRPVGTYIQSLILLAMLAAELVHDTSTRLIRFTRVWQLQICTIAILFLSLLVSLFTADFQFMASSKGLQALAVLTIIGNLALCIVFLCYIVHGYTGSAKEWMLWGKHHVSTSFAKHDGFRQFVASAPAKIGRRQSSGEPMLPFGMASPARTASVEMTPANSPENLRRSSSILSSQEIAGIWASSNRHRSP